MFPTVVCKAHPSGAKEGLVQQKKPNFLCGLNFIMPSIGTKFLSAVAVYEMFASSPFFVISEAPCDVDSIYSNVSTYSHVLLAGDSLESTSQKSLEFCTAPNLIIKENPVLILTGGTPKTADYVQMIRECINGALNAKKSRGGLQPDAGENRVSFYDTSPKSIYFGKDVLFASSCMAKHIGGLYSNALSEHDICSNHLPAILLKLKIGQIFVLSAAGLPSCDGRIVPVDLKGMVDHMQLNTGQSRISFPIAELVQAPVTSAPLFPSMDIDSRNYDHIIVISDLHGDYEAGVQSLCIGVRQVVVTQDIDCSQFATEIRSRLDRISSGEPLVGDAMYSGLRVLVIQMGDIVDRGPNAKDLYLLFDRLEEILGWRTVSVMGNHEIMQHEAAYSSYPGVYGKLPPYVSSEDISMYGNLAKRCAEFSNGLTWERILSKYVMFVRVGVPGGGGTLFTHGGVELPWIRLMHPSADLANLNVDEINLKARHVLNRKPEAMLDDWFYGDQDGAPFWTRSLSLKNEMWKSEPSRPLTFDYERGLPFQAKRVLLKGSLCDEVIDPILKAFKVDRVIVGHTPQYDEIVKSKCDGKIILSDVTISRWMHVDQTTPNPMALVMRVNTDGSIKKIVAHYNTHEDPKGANPIDAAVSRIPPPGVVNSLIRLPVYISE